MGLEIGLFCSYWEGYSIFTGAVPAKNNNVVLLGLEIVL